MKYLYKYRPIDEHFFSMLIKGELFFQKPDAFNDPFDSTTPVNMSPSDEQIENMIKKSFPFGVDKEKLSIAINFYKNSNNIESLINQSTKIQPKDNMYLCCLSKLWNNILMWTHYANSHKGICVGFKVREANENTFIHIQPTQFFPTKFNGVNSDNIMAIKMKYSTKRPASINLIGSDAANVSIAINEHVKTKSTLWKYEKEYRLVLDANQFPNPNEASQKIYIPTTEIGEIIFGSRINPVYEKLIIGYLKDNSKNYDNIKIFKSYLSTTNYKILRKEIKLR